MDIEQITNRLLVGRGRTYVVDISESREFPGYVRTVLIRPDSKVEIHFEQYGYDEGGLCFLNSYPSLQDAVTALERYLNQPLSAWPRLAEYPASMQSNDSSEGHTRLKAAIADHRVSLPEGGPWTLLGDYWRQFLKDG